MIPWPERVANAPMPTRLYHCTTPRKLAQYHATGRILPPIRGFDTMDAAKEWGRIRKRSLIVEVTPSSPVYPLPDHHQSEGLAWWTLTASAFNVVYDKVVESR